MQLARSIKCKVYEFGAVKIFLPLFFLFFSFYAVAQDNSPYSRYGLGDAAPLSNNTTRGMGGISAGFADVLSINFSNPASYSQFQAFTEQRSKKLSAGRVVFDVGINFQNRTLVEPNTVNRFTSSDAVFSYLQVGVPLKKNWGLSFGIRPLSRISYFINNFEMLKDPQTGLVIDSGVTQYRGSGGSYLPTIGTGFGFGKKNTISFGINAGYLFGSRDNERLRSLIDSNVFYYSSSHTTNTSFGGLFFNAGIQYKAQLNETKTGITHLRLGLSGNWQQNIKANQDVLVQTFTRGASGEEVQIDSVFQQDNTKGQITYPATYKAGFTIQRSNTNGSGWLFGADYTTNKWEQYRFFGQKDSVKNNWMVNIGGQFNARPKSNFFSKATYRFGVFAGPDYIQVRQNIPQYGITFGMGLPIGGYNRLSPNQFSMLNIALEYGKRGNNENSLKENLFRVSVGFNFTDLWFGKKKYE